MKHKMSGVIAAVAMLIVAAVACQAATTGEPTAAPPTGAAAATATLAAAPTPEPPTSIPEPSPTTDPCIKWDQVTTDMKGETVCMRGTITKFDQSRQVGTRYSFSDKSGTFFLFSAKYEITNPNTGKTIAPGTCVEVTAPIDVQADTPFINLDKLIEYTGDEVQGFLFYEDTSACE